MRKFFLWLSLIVFLYIAIHLSGKATKQILLPKGAQHNTIGELPIVEVMDDGDFFERDGDEDLIRETYFRNGISVLKKQCKANLKGYKLKRCLRDANNLMPNINGYLKCDDLEKIGKRYNFYACFTCWGTWGY